MTDVSAAVKRRELKKLIRVYQDLLDDPEQQLAVFPKAYLSVELAVSKETADGFCRKVLLELEERMGLLVEEMKVQS